MEASNEITLPKGLKHWINSIKSKECTLYNTLADLFDGRCICELVEHIFQSSGSFEDTKTPAGLIQSALNVIADNIGWNSIPPEFKQRNAAYRLAQGEPMFMCVFIQYLHGLSVSLPKGMSGDVDTDVENALNDLRLEAEAGATAESWEEPRYLSEQPLSYAEYIALAEHENDSLEGEDELNVVSSSEIRRQRSKALNKTGKLSRPSAASHLRASTSTSRHTTPPLRFSQQSSTAHSAQQPAPQFAKSQQSQADIIAAAHTATQQRLHMHAKRAKSPTDTATNSTAKSKLSVSAPTSIKVRAGQGLSVGSSMVDPKYQPGGKRIFTETPPQPEPVDFASSSESEDSIRPIYDHTHTGQLTGRRHGSARIPHSRSISPVSRRHLHCQLRDSVQPPSVHRNRSVSPNEAKILRANNQYQQPYRVDPNSVHHSGYSSTEERIFGQRRPSAEREVPESHAPQSRRSDKAGTNEIQKKQSKAVLGVFKRNEQRASNQAMTKPVVDIDSVISIERKNSILSWIQRQLGIRIDTHISATTSSQYNRTAGQHVVSPDSIAVVPNWSEKSEKRADKGTQEGKKGSHKHPNGEIDKENYHFYPAAEDAQYIPSRSANSFGTFSIATYLGKVTDGAASYTANVANQVVLQQCREVVLQIPESMTEGAAGAPSSSSGFKAPPYVKAPTTSIGFLNDPWIGGLLLSEIVAALSVENRALIKQVDNYDRFGRIVLPPKLIISGTEYTIKSRAQAIHNIQLCMDLLSSTIPGFPTLDYSAEDIVSGGVSLWKLLYATHEAVKHTYRHNSGVRGRARCRSTSPEVSAHHRDAYRSISAPPAPDRKSGSSGAVSVSFADTQHEPRTGDKIPRPASPPQRQHPAGSGKPASTAHTANSKPAGQSRSVSPASNAPPAVPSNVPSNPLLELRRQEKDHERERARLYTQRKRMQQEAGMAAGLPVAPSESGEKGWVSTTSVERPRSSSAPRRASVTSTGQSTAGSSAATSAQSGAAGPAGKPAAAAPATTAPSSSSAHKSWHPPKLTATEVEAAQNCYLPSVSVFQQRSIRDWLVKAFDIRLLDEECGFYYNSEAGSKDVPAESSHTELKTERKFDPKFESVPQHAPTPLSLQDDRVRNGVLLGQLLLRLEPNAAIHAHIPRLLHKHPRSLELSLENLERVLWVFKLRRSPPVPLQYLCQPEEILKGHDKVIWGLLWELMQAYPYVTLQEKASFGTNTGGANKVSNVPGVMVANKHHLTPQPGHGKLKTTIRSGLNKLFNSPPAKQENRRPSLGLKGSEAKHNVPGYMRYNYADPHLENPVEAHTLPYSDAQRHQLDLSLLSWLDETRLLGDIIGSLSKPITILALECYCKDGTLFCLLVEKVLKLTFVKDWHHSPSTYVECMSNLKNCLDLLRKCQTMKSRFLYAGAEEDICRGKWDVILGLLEDMHRYSDGVHPHAQIFSTIDAHGRTVGQGGAVAGSDAASFDFTTVDAPYLGRFATRVPLPQQSGTGPSSNVSAAPVQGGRLGAVPSQQSNLMHDVAYSYEPQLNIYPSQADSAAPPPPPVRAKRPSLAEQMAPLPMDASPPSSATGARRTGDLFPSNVVSGRNVTTLLSTVDSSPEADSLAGSAHRKTTPRHSSGIPTPVRTRPPAYPQPAPTAAQKQPAGLESQFVAAGAAKQAKPSALPSWVETTLNSAGSGKVEPGGAPGRRTANHYEVDSGGGSNEASRLSQALSFPDSDNEQQRPPRVPTARSTQTPSPRPGNTQHRRRSPASPTPSRHLNSTVGNISMMSEYEADSLGGDSSASSTPEDAGKSKLDPMKMRRLAKWFNELGISVPRKNERSFATRDAFSDGVILCTLLQTLERSGALPGTFTAPKTHSERVQNVRRCLELLATRHKSIPLRELSCEEDILQGDLKRTVKLLFSIKKAYAAHRR